MSNLKFESIRYSDEPKLMYVTFLKDGKEYKWFPKWAEVVKLCHKSWATESFHNQGKDTEYIIASMLFILLRNSLAQYHWNNPNPVLMSKLFTMIEDEFQDDFSEGNNHAEGR